MNADLILVVVNKMPAVSTRIGVMHLHGKALEILGEKVIKTI